MVIPSIRICSVAGAAAMGVVVVVVGGVVKWDRLVMLRRECIRRRLGLKARSVVDGVAAAAVPGDNYGT